MTLEGSTGFGDVPFGMLRDTQSGVLNDWTRTPKTVTRGFPGGTGASTQFTHPGVYTATYRLHLETVEDYRALQAKQQTVDTLALFEPATSMPGTFVWRFDQGYVQLDNVMLLELRNVSVFTDRSVECDSTWQVSG